MGRPTRRGRLMVVSNGGVNANNHRTTDSSNSSRSSGIGDTTTNTTSASINGGSERRPPRRAAPSSQLFKYQLACNPKQVEENDLKRALQESLEEQASFEQLKTQARPMFIASNNATGSSNGRSANKSANSATCIMINNSTNSSDVSRTSSSSSSTNTPNSTGSSIRVIKCKVKNSLSKKSSLTSTPLRSPQPPSSSKNVAKNQRLACNKTTPNGYHARSRLIPSSKPHIVHKNSSVVKMQSAGTKTHRGNSNCGTTNDLSTKTSQTQTDLTVTTKRSAPCSWSLLGVPEEKVIYLKDEDTPRRLICYPAIKHIEGDVIQVRDSVLLRSGAKKTDLPYIAKVCAFWQDAETGNILMSLLWYYRPEHTEEGRKSHHLIDEVFASRHRDVDSVECIEDKCYVLTFNEYCRYKKRCKMEQVNANWSLTDVTIPLSNEMYPRRNRIPDSDVNPELVFCCRQIYDSRMRRLVKNPLINPKYGHI